MCANMLHNSTQLDTTQAHLCVGSLSLGDLIFFVAQYSPAPSRQIHNFYLMVQSGWAFGRTLREIDVSHFRSTEDALWKLCEDAGATLTFYPHSVVSVLLSILFPVCTVVPSLSQS